MIDIDKFNYEGKNIFYIFNFLKNAGRQKESGKFESVFSIRKRMIKEYLLGALYLYTVKNLFFNRYDYIIFTHSDNYKIINGELKHRLFGDIFKDKNLKILEIQYAENSKIIRSGNKIFHYYTLKLLWSFLYFFTKISDISQIQSSLSEAGINMNAKRVIKKYIAKRNFLKFVYKLTKPKGVFSSTCAFSDDIIVATDMGIKTYEFQHGIMRNHNYYENVSKYAKSEFVTYLFTFGQNEVDFFKDRTYAKNMLINGNLQIDYFKDRTNKDILLLKDSFKFIICVSLQDALLNECKEQVKIFAKKYKDICFILIPRHNLQVSNNDTCSNIKILKDLNTYEIIANCDFHMTCYSTCAIEAPSLGTPNIFLNINNTSYKYFSEYINSHKFNYVINTQDGLDFLYNQEPLKKEELIQENEYYISSKYQQNIKMIEEVIFNE